ncbi:Serpentine Receptor, class H [Caenorhabditis elegans]|uniref:Serpentine Receptor, class H n=2 Tax=Caenorhabditis elegans TaxID=6239 RepID=Q9XU90_CAEEL|nr:Serpentine Receptor, class H [Caenorhabditis elegans]CAB05533.2 Serpentine Receptor, class H [Caenorhabditis elegans]|eukprot:NP_001256703.1 Serpentine Receptor, class H [Caenorhabditis elegans]
MCTETFSYLASDQLYAGALHIFTAFEVPVHLFGAYIIIFKTPDKMKSVRTSMLSLHLVGAFVDFFTSFLTAPVLILPVCAGYPLGVLGMLGIPTSVQTYFGLSFLAVLASAVILFFEERYHKLANVQRSSGRKSFSRKCYAIGHYMFAMLFISPCYFNIPDQEIEKLTINERIPCLPEEILSRTGFFILSIENREMYISLALLISVLVPEVLFFVLSIFWHLFNIKSQSRATNRLQKQLFFAMCLQVYIPFMVVTIPAAYCISSIVFGHYNQAATNLAMSSIAVHGILLTITMLIVHAPYRQAVLEIICNRSKMATINNPQIWKTVNETKL